MTGASIGLIEASPVLRPWRTVLWPVAAGELRGRRMMDRQGGLPETSGRSICGLREIWTTRALPRKRLSPTPPLTTAPNHRATARQSWVWPLRISVIGGETEDCFCTGSRASLPSSISQNYTAGQHMGPHIKAYSKPLSLT